MKTISASSVKWKLRKYLKSRIFWSRKIILFDGQYDLIDETKLKLEPVRLSAGDCEERAWVMMGRVVAQQPRGLFGFTEGYDRRGLKHAWCFMMVNSEILKYVEPVTAEVFLPTTEKIYHFIR